MDMVDVYKLIFQSIMGPGHILQNEEKAFLFLKQEYKSNIPVYEKSMYTDIVLENELVRVNIPIYKKVGSADQIFAMMRETAAYITPNKTVLNNYWNTLGDLIKKNRIENLSINDYKILTDFLHDHDFPHLSHSEKYKKLYNPSYRIVLKELLKKYIH
ncbi:MAG TPA: hypothetical protein ENK03_01175 [Candidatus Cloacimonetes bacterium]|nr:hypothetical protein [Candidatus Cloacimonadota bacterium]